MLVFLPHLLFKPCLPALFRAWLPQQLPASSPALLPRSFPFKPSLALVLLTHSLFHFPFHFHWHPPSPMLNCCPFFSSFWSSSTPQASLPLHQHHSLLPKLFRNTIADLCKHRGLQHQTDAIMAALPPLSSSFALKGMSPGDLPYSAPIKFQQVLPHQFLTHLNSSNIKYIELDLLQFVADFLDSIRHSSAHQQPYMSTHLSHLMDLASHFQWSAIRAYDRRILKALKQGTTTWSADFTCFLTGLLLPSQELPHRRSSSNPTARRAARRGQKESVCKD